MTRRSGTTSGRAGSLFDRTFRDPDTGKLAVAQFPNAPLAIFLVAKGVRLVLDPDGTVGTVLSVTAGLALLWWAVAEIGWGDSLFRRLLGGVVLAGLAADVFIS